MRVSSTADYRAAFGRSDPPSPLDHAVDLFFAGGGTDAVVVRAASPGAEHVVPVRGPGGLGSILEGFSVLVLPGLTSSSSRAVERALARCAQERAVLLLDLPADADARSAALHADQVRGARHRVAAYHPWLVVGTSTASDGRTVGGTLVPPSGAVAGALASTGVEGGAATTSTDEELVLRGVDSLAGDLDADQAELLAAHAVNALRDLPDRRRVVRGGRLLGATTSAAPSSSFLAVRRLTDHVLESLEQGMAFVAGRRSDPGLADQVRRGAEDFLVGLWRSGALAGTGPQEAFFVRCDRSTTTAADEAAGCMVLRVGLATVRPSEFEVHDLVLETSTAAGAELLDAPAGLARATALARERRTVVRREALAPLVSGHLEESERRLRRVFDSAAHASTVLLLEDADALAVRTGDGRARHRAVDLARLLRRLSHETGVPVVLARGR